MSSFKKESDQLSYGLTPELAGTLDISDMTMNGSGVRDIGRVLKISPTTVISHLKNYHLVQ